MVVKKSEQANMLKIWERESPEMYNAYKGEYFDNGQWMLGGLMQRDLNSYAVFLCKTRWVPKAA
jgi:hypothetical protein